MEDRSVFASSSENLEGYQDLSSNNSNTRTSEFYIFHSEFRFIAAEIGNWRLVCFRFLKFQSAFSAVGGFEALLKKLGNNLRCYRLESSEALTPPDY